MIYNASQSKKKLPDKNFVKKYKNAYQSSLKNMSGETKYAIT